MEKQTRKSVLDQIFSNPDKILRKMEKIVAVLVAILSVIILMGTASNSGPFFIIVMTIITLLCLGMAVMVLRQK